MQVAQPNQTRPFVSLEARARAVARPHPTPGGRRLVHARALGWHRGRRG